MARKTPTSLLFLALAAAVAAVALHDRLPALTAAAEPATAPVAGSIDVYFSPNGGATDAIVRELAGAKKQVRILAYSFTSAPIAAAVRDAHRRGVDVTVILDKSQRSEKYSSATFLHNAGVPVVIDEAHAIQHNKVVLIDGVVVISGSFNFSKAAEERNAENLLVIRDKDLAAKYLAEWERHREHSEPYSR